MPHFNNKAKLESSEKQHMELVYRKLESILNNAERESAEKKRVAKLGLSDDHHYQIAYGEWACFLPFPTCRIAIALSCR